MQLKYHSGRRTIGIIIDRFEHRYQYTLSRFLKQYAKEKGVNLIFFNGFNIKSPLIGEDQFNLIYDLVNVNYLDGIIIPGSSMAFSTSAEELLVFCGRFNSVPVVSISMDLPGYPSIMPDNKGGMKEAVCHLIEEHGAKRIGFIRGPNHNQEAQLRYQGYLEALSEHQIPFSQSLVFQGNFLQIQDKKDLTSALMKRGMDSLAVANDEMALEAEMIILECGLKIPDDIRIVSYDNLLTSLYSDPSLSTVNQPIDLLAEKALDTVLQILDKKSPPALQVIETSFIVRNSCGCSARSSAEGVHDTVGHFTELEKKTGNRRNYFKTLNGNLLQWRYFSRK
jgi:DNA-binding LacI/PurR family transcriptional regulator